MRRRSQALQIGAARDQRSVATAIRAATLGPGEVVTLSAGKQQAASPRTRVIVAAGTGLGVAQLVEHGGVWLALPSEGGHVCFAPRNAEECALLAFLSRRHGRVSLERVVSGRGLASLYEFLLERGEPAQPAVARRSLANPEAAPPLSGTAAAGSCPVPCARSSCCGAMRRSLRQFRTGRWLPTAFSWAAESSEILPKQNGRFVSDFDKGRFRPLMSRSGT
jgi:glucokinase